VTYAIFWYVIAIKICASINKSAKDNSNNITLLHHTWNITFDKVLPYGFPFKIGCKFVNLTENAEEFSTSQKYITTHKGLVTFGYDLIKGGLFFSNNGESVVKIKPQVSGFGVRVVADNSYFFKLPLSKKLFQYLRENVRSFELMDFVRSTDSFELINFIKNLEIKAKDIKAYDLVDNTLIFDHESTKLNLAWDHSYYYKNFDELINNIPQKYNLNARIIIKEVASNRKIIAPYSPIYFILPNAKFETDLIAEITTKVKRADLKEISENIGINVEKFHLITPLISSDFHGIITTEDFGSRKSGIFNFVLDLTLNKLDELNAYLNALSADLRKEVEPILSSASGGFLHFVADGNYTFGQKLKNLNLESLNLLINDKVGFNIKSKSSFSSINDWYLEGNILVFNFEDIVNQVFYLFGKYEKFDEKQLNDLKEPTKLLLRGISSYPVSESQNLAIDFQLSHNIGTSKIGNIPIRLFLESYSKIINKH
jgi:hypothetical protein